MSTKLPPETIEIECLKASVEMTIRERLAGKSPDYQDGYQDGMMVLLEYQNELMKIYRKE